MNVSELLGFTRWMAEHGEAARGKYDALTSVLSHNASQPQKQPVEEPLEDLLETLKSLPLQQLTLEQAGMLGPLGVDGFVGREGVNFVDQTVRAGDYDPATAASRIAEARDAIDQAISKMRDIQHALENLDFIDEIDAIDAEGITLRLQFKNEASISNVVDLKDWSDKWHDIIRGVALCVDQAPEQARVVGATNGSLILVLSGTLAVVKLMALMAKHVTSIIKQGFDIAGAAEDLKQKKLLTEAIEQDLQRQREEIDRDGVQKIVDAIQEELAVDLDGEKGAALRRSVEKYLEFNKRGGELDFVSPPEEAGGGEMAGGMDADEITDFRRIVEEVRTTRAELMMLARPAAEVDEGAEADKGNDKA